MSIAWSYLTDLQRAQLQHCRPELHLGVQRCKRCLNGQVISGACLQCGAEVDENGELIVALSAEEIKSLYGNEGHRNKLIIQ